MAQDDQRDSNFPAGLSQPARRALAGAGYWRLEQLANHSEAEIKELHGIGPKALDQLRHALETLGLSFSNEENRKRSG
jgi:ERCC4-type nuclease